MVLTANDLCCGRYHFVILGRQTVILSEAKNLDNTGNRPRFFAALRMTAAGDHRMIRPYGGPDGKGISPKGRYWHTRRIMPGFVLADSGRDVIVPPFPSPLVMVSGAFVVLS